MRDPDGKRYCGKVVFGETTETNHTRYQTKELRDQIIEMGEEANIAQIFERLDMYTWLHWRKAGFQGWVAGDACTVT